MAENLRLAFDGVCGAGTQGLKALREEGINKLYVVSMEAMPRRRDDIDILPWKMFLDRLWKQEL